MDNILHRRIQRLMRPRSINIEQFAGIGMMVISIYSFARPSTITIGQLNAIYGFSIPVHFFTVLFLVCGWLLSWKRSAALMVFSILTLPFLIYGLLLLAYAITSPLLPITAAAISIVAFFGLQYIYAKEQFWRSRKPPISKTK